MGVPAVLRISSDDHDGTFHVEWASPERIIPLLARWIENCRTGGAIPTATNYRDFAAAAVGDHVCGDYPTGAADPDNIQYRYAFRTGAYGNGWVGDLTVFRAHQRPDREPLLTIWHQASFSHTDTSSLHQLAFPRCPAHHQNRQVTRPAPAHCPRAADLDRDRALAPVPGRCRMSGLIVDLDEVGAALTHDQARRILRPGDRRPVDLYYCRDTTNETYYSEMIIAAPTRPKRGAWPTNWRTTKPTCGPTQPQHSSTSSARPYRTPSLT